MSSQSHPETWKLLHPELMSREELVLILKERHVQIDEVTCKEKEKLVEIFRRIAMPQAQRARFQKDSAPSQMEVDKPANHINSSRNSQSIPNLQVQESSSSRVQSSSSSKVRLKRDISLVNGNVSNEGPNLKKRERITWP